MTVFRAYEERRGYLSAVAENTGRHVILSGTFTSTGNGEILNPDPFRFGVQLVSKPNVSYAYEVDGDALVDSVWPRCWGGIYDWETTDQGLYTGANAFVVVDASHIFDGNFSVEGSPATPLYTITHHFTFNGIALKFASADVPAGFDDL